MDADYIQAVPPVNENVFPSLPSKICTWQLRTSL